MKSLRLLLRKIDIFGVPLNFKYKKEDKFSTTLGGIIIIAFCVLALVFGIYYFIPFYKRQNLSIIYYTMNIPETETIRFKDSQAAFAIGLDCEANGRFKAEDVFKLESRHVIYIKETNGSYHKAKQLLSSHKCKYEDFYNNYNNSFDYLKLKTYECLDNYDKNLQGIYADQIFSYYEFSVTAINDIDITFNNIDEYLEKNDCKLQIVYTDITIDLSNYKEPIKPFLNSFFIQVNPTLYIKRNVYFTNQYLYDDDSVLGVFDSKQDPDQIKTLFSRYEEYALYIGLNREIKRQQNYINYAKIYMRADLKKTEIRRTYQKVTEFYADASSILVALYEVLIIIISTINKFYGENSIIKKLFLFKGINNKYFNIQNKYNKINELISLTNSDSLSNNLMNNRSKNQRAVTQIFNINNNIDNKYIDFDTKDPISNRSRDSKRVFKTHRINRKKSSSKNIYTTEYLHKESERKYNVDVIHLKDEDKDKNDINALNTIGKDDLGNTYDKFEHKNIEYSFNCFEMIASLLFPCCLPGNTKIKNNYYNNGIDFLYQKLDIILYIRNVILFDIINQTIINNNKKQIINLLSRPVLSLDNKEAHELDIFYKNYKENEFEKFYDGMIDLINKPDKENREKNLIELSNKKLKALI